MPSLGVASGIKESVEGRRMTESFFELFKGLELKLADFSLFFVFAGKVGLFVLLALFLTTGAVMLESRIRERLFGRKGKGFKQAFADMVRLMMQKPLQPGSSDKVLFFWVPIISFVASLFFLLMLPTGQDGEFLRLRGGLLYLLFAGVLFGYTFFLGGLAGGSRFSFLGALRSLAETFSCQLILMLTSGVVLMTAGSTDLSDIVSAQRDVWYVFIHFPMFIMFMLSLLTLTGGAPFGTSRGSYELSGGVYSEYSGGLYLFFKSADYILLLAGSLLSALLFFGGWNAFMFFGTEGSCWYLLAKTGILFCLFVLLRSSLPSYKTEDAMAISYKCFLPLSAIWFFVTAFFILFEGGGVQ